MTRTARARAYLKERGPAWTLLYAVRKGLRAALLPLERSVDQRLVRIEKQRHLTGPGTISSISHTVENNLRKWDTWNWSDHGEGWTEEVRRFRGLEPEVWRQTIVKELIDGYIAPGSTVLEIGPGAGRWTEFLYRRAGRLLIADISARCIDICRERFKTAENIEYHVIHGGHLGFVSDHALDAIWAYDVFVHINPSDTERYLEAFPRVLKPQGVAMIHHSGTYDSDEAAAAGWRSHLTADLFAELARRHGLVVLSQNTTLPHYPGDVISILQARPLA